MDLANEVTQFTTKAGKKGIAFDGFQYRFDKRTLDGLFTWRCLVTGCSGRLQTNDDYSNPEKRGEKDHDHLPDPELSQVRSVISKMRERAATETTSIPAIYQDEKAVLAGAEAAEAAAAVLPSHHSLASSLYRARRKRYPPLPPTREAIDIPQTFAQTTTGMQFLLIDQHEFIVYGTDANLRKLSESPDIYVDGTFDAVPHLFRQLFTIHAFIETKQVPLVYCLMLSKSRADYVLLFRALKDKARTMGLRFNPQLIMSDFESGLILAIQDEFPAAIHRGCYFHHTKCVWRQVQALGLQAAYTADVELREQVRELMAIGFAPVGMVRQVFNQMRQRADGRLAELFAYFEREWINQIALPMWNMYAVERRTNNDVEGWHHKFNKKVQVHHPNLWHLIEVIQKEQADTEVTIQQIRGGQVVKRTNNKYVAVNAKIERARGSFNRHEISVFEYIHRISYILPQFGRAAR